MIFRNTRSTNFENHSSLPGDRHQLFDGVSVIALYAL